MSSFTEQMQDLAAAVMKSHEDRKAWLGAFRQEMGVFGEKIGAISKERRSWVGSLRNEVRRMRGEMSADRDGARQAWQRTAGIVAAQRRVRGPFRPENKPRHRE